MRNRHIPRLCRACTAPMASQEETCWSCGAAYRSVDRTHATTAAARWDDDGGPSVVMTNGARHVSLTTPRTTTGRHNGATRIG